MLNQRAPLLCIFGIFFVFFIYTIGFAQSGQGSNSALSTSQYVELIKEIRQLDTNMTKNISQLESKMRDHVDDKVSALSTDINNLRNDVAFINGQLSLIKWALTIFGGPLLLIIIGAMVTNYLQNRRNKNTVAAQSGVKEPIDRTNIAILADEPTPKDFLIQDNNKSNTI